jgi:hypothetical protein
MLMRYCIGFVTGAVVRDGSCSGFPFISEKKNVEIT